MTPRMALVLVFLFSDFLGRAYATTLWPLLGFLFMPLTTLAYATAINWNGEVTGLYFVMVLFAVLADLGLVGGSGRGHLRRRHAPRRRHGGERVIDASFD
ncbi:MAG: hypothetical protein V3T05_07300 [Myxococcota bacterium]